MKLAGQAYTGVLDLLARVAADLGQVARACIRVNPDVDARTHEYTTTGKEENKFGVQWSRVPAVFAEYRDVASVDLVGLHVHIGSGSFDLAPFLEAADRLFDLARSLPEVLQFAESLF